MLYKLFHYFSLLQFTLNVSSSLLMWKGVSSAPEAIMILKIWFVSDITYDVIPEVKKFWIMGYKSASWIKLSTAPSLLLPSKLNDASFIVWFSHCNPLSAAFSTLEMVVLANGCSRQDLSCCCWINDGSGANICSLDSCLLSFLVTLSQLPQTQGLVTEILQCIIQSKPFLLSFRGAFQHINSMCNGNNI